MSVRVMTWVWSHSRSNPTHRLVLLAIADCANDVGEQAYPSAATLAKKTGLSERGVRAALAGLATLGELQIDYKAGPRGCNRYRIVMKDPAPDAGSDTLHEVHSARGAGSTRHEVQGTRHETTGNPARGAPEPLENRPTTSVEPSVPRKRGSATKGTRIPDDFAATADMIAWARTNTPLVGIRETAAFVDYWRGQPGARGVKADWPATWRNWMRRSQKDAESGRTNERASSMVEVNGMRLRPERAEQIARRARFMTDQPALEGPR